MKELSIAIFLITLVSLVVSVSQAMPRHFPAQMPATLLDLFRHSDVVFEARFDRVDEGDVVRQDQDYSVVRVKKLFDVSSTLKGGHSKFISLSEDEYRYPATQASANYLLARAESEETEQTYGLRSGDPVLLFLKYGEDGKTLELTDDEEGLKKLSSNDIAIYEQRIRELDALLSDDEPSAAAIVDWMMRCAEEPATRWEATFELIKGFERLDYQTKQKQTDTELPNTVVADKPDFFDSTTFARAVTEEQQRRLADILLDRRQPQIGDDGQAKRTYVRGDRELIDLVKHWGDPRLAGFLLNELKTKDLTDYRKSETMQLIADMLGDQKITGLADKYSTSYRNEAIAGQLFDNQEAANTSAKNSTDYKQTRAAIMAKFIRLASSVVAPGPNNTEN